MLHVHACSFCDSVKYPPPPPPLAPTSGMPRPTITVRVTRVVLLSFSPPQSAGSKLCVQPPVPSIRAHCILPRRCCVHHKCQGEVHPTETQNGGPAIVFVSGTCGYHWVRPAFEVRQNQLFRQASPRGPLCELVYTSPGIKRVLRIPSRDILFRLLLYLDVRYRGIRSRTQSYFSRYALILTNACILRQGLGVQSKLGPLRRLAL